MKTEEQPPSWEEQVTIQAVGHPYNGAAGPTEPGPRYNFRYGYHTLTIFQNDLDQKTLQAYNEAPARLGFWKSNPVMWAIFEFQGLGWQDAPYTPHRVEPQGRTLTELTGPESRYPLTIMVVSAEDSVVRAIRFATMSPRVSQEARDINQELTQAPFTEREFDRKIKEAYLHYQSSEEMAWLPRYMDFLGT